MTHIRDTTDHGGCVGSLAGAANATGFQTHLGWGVEATLYRPETERIDHAFLALTDPELTPRLGGQRFAITICPTSNVALANCFDRIEGHVYTRMREAGCWPP